MVRRLNQIRVFLERVERDGGHLGIAPGHTGKLCFAQLRTSGLELFRSCRRILLC
jgi:hypothetical protein